MKHALVIGGAGGLGAALVARLLDDGLEVSVAGRGPAADPRVRRSVPLDATRADWPALLADLQAGGAPPIDVVVFVAGAAVFGRTPAVPVAEARQVLELNFWACSSAALAAGEAWSAAGRPGTFLAVLSIVARRAVPFEAWYSASKAATARFLECLQLEYEPRGIRFLAAYPGMLKTPFRRRAAWHGLAPDLSEAGADVRETAAAVSALLRGRRKAAVIGWRERTIDLADRVLPGLYDRAVLRRRVRRTFPGGWKT